MGDVERVLARAVLYGKGLSKWTELLRRSHREDGLHRVEFGYKAIC